MGLISIVPSIHEPLSTRLCVWPIPNTRIVTGDSPASRRGYYVAMTLLFRDYLGRCGSSSRTLQSAM